MPERIRQRQQVADHPRPKRHVRRLLVPVMVVLAVAGLYISLHKSDANADKSVTTKPTTALTQSSTATKATTAKVAAPQACNGVTERNIIVSISQRHLWACDGTSQMYDSAVVTGMQKLAADLTPIGSYHISAKYTERYLRGSDSTGSWNDYVHYWMPWLHNQYGNYGFHDATWRDPAVFGNIDPNSSDGSHGCVELPLAAAAWLYNWASVGTTVTIKA